VLVAQELGCRPENILICSTGLIGIPLPMPALEGGIKPLTSSLSPDAADAAADAILTTDTARKTVSVDAPGFTVGGMAKGAAMLAPNMATMLAVLTTDAAVEPPALQQALAGATSASFNEITVDGCTSTNDTVIVLASGKRSAPDPTTFTEVLTAACAGLARQMVADAEGATKFATVTVTGATTDDEARRAARRVAESQLVKCSLYGADPYWGRILSELGSAGVAFDPSRVTIAYGDITVCAGGVAAAHDTAAVKAHLTTERDVRLSADLGLGAGRATVLTSDLTHAYIDENMRTS
jgi:glutamate N-acetyltransferase/amino-acid N-acetyltransferase